MFRRSPKKKAANTARQEHNTRFNNRDTDPDSADYLASHDRVVTAEQAAKTTRR